MNRCEVVPQKGVIYTLPVFDNENHIPSYIFKTPSHSHLYDLSRQILFLINYTHYLLNRLPNYSLKSKSQV